MFADDTSLNTSDKNTHTVQKELQRSINEASDWCDNNAMILSPTTTKSLLLATRQKYQLCPLHLNLSLNDTHIEQVYEHGILAISLMMNLSGDHTLLAHVKQLKKICICCHS